jgi:hypothetical protein
MHLVRLTVILAIAAALVAGCGSSDDTDAATTEPAASPLSRERYVEVERLARAQLPLDDDAQTEDPIAFRRLADRIARTCDRADTSDKLIAALVDGCRESMSAFSALAASDCATPTECARLMLTIADAMDDLVTTVRGNEPLIVAEVPDPACQKALLSPESTAAYVEGIDVLRDAAVGLASGNPSEVAAASSDIDAMEAKFDALPSARAQLERFRRACR